MARDLALLLSKWDRSFLYLNLNRELTQRGATAILSWISFAKQRPCLTVSSLSQALVRNTATQHGRLSIHQH